MSGIIGFKNKFNIKVFLRFSDSFDGRRDRSPPPI